MALIKVNSAYCEIKRLDECIDEIGPRGLEYTKVYREDELELRGLYGSSYGGLVIKVMKINLKDRKPLYTIIMVAIDDNNNGKSFDRENDTVIIGCPSADRAVTTKTAKLYNNLDELSKGLDVRTIVFPLNNLNEIAQRQVVGFSFTNSFVEEKTNKKETIELNRTSLSILFKENGLEMPSARELDEIFDANDNFRIKNGQKK